MAKRKAQKVAVKDDAEVKAPEEFTGPGTNDAAEAEAAAAAAALAAAEAADTEASAGSDEGGPAADTSEEVTAEAEAEDADTGDHADAKATAAELKAKADEAAAEAADAEKFVKELKTKEKEPVKMESTRPLEERVAKRAFRFHGRHFPIGHVFPWRKLSCSERKVLHLEHGGFLMSARAFENAGHEVVEEAETE